MNRAVSYLGGLSGLFFLMFLFRTVSLQATGQLNFAFAALGFLIGILVELPIALFLLRSIERRGEYKATRLTWMFILIFVVFFVLGTVLVLYPVLKESLQAQLVLSNAFPGPGLTGSYFVSFAVFLRWEKRNKSVIMFNGILSTRWFAYPVNLA